MNEEFDKRNKNSKNNIKEYPIMFSLKECRELLPEIYEITEKYYNKIENVSIKLLESDNREEKRLQRRINLIINKWTQEMYKLNLKVIGLWTVDFDSGDGIYYCWKYPEKELKYFHLYGKGIKSRRLISLLEGKE
jgi:hypothetical protein